MAQDGDPGRTRTSDQPLKRLLRSARIVAYFRAEQREDCSFVPYPGAASGDLCATALVWAALRTALTAVALGAITTVQAFGASTGTDATSARAPGLQNIFTYSTSGQVDPSQGVNGANVISFDSVPLQKTADQVNSFVTPTSFSLGAFRVGSLPDGQMTTYTDTPFSLEENADEVSSYMAKLRQAVLDALQEEAVLVVALPVYHPE